MTHKTHLRSDSFLFVYGLLLGGKVETGAQSAGAKRGAIPRMELRRTSDDTSSSTRPEDLRCIRHAASARASRRRTAHPALAAVAQHGLFLHVAKEVAAGPRKRLLIAGISDGLEHLPARLFCDHLGIAHNAHPQLTARFVRAV